MKNLKSLNLKKLPNIENPVYRHEEKYYFPKDMMHNLETRLKVFANNDIHGDKGTYSVYSIYFDDYSNTFMRDNENGVDPREKWRIRIYDHKLDKIHLERKDKKNGLINKTTQEIGIDDYYSFVNNKYPSKINRSGENDLRCLFISKIISDGIIPVVGVEYERKAYVFQYNHIRITIDYNISCVDNNFINYSQKYPLLGAGIALMEVKYHNRLPVHICDVIQAFDMQRIANSKYYLARLSKYERWGK